MSRQLGRTQRSNHRYRVVDLLTKMASLRGSSGAAGRPVRFHLTGFGKFNGVADNPSKHVVAAIAAANGVQTVPETRSAAGDVAVSCSPPAATPGPGVLASGTRLASATIFETSAQGAGNALEALHASHDADDATSESFIVYLHLGVSSRSEFSLELQGVNEVGAVQADRACRGAHTLVVWHTRSRRRFVCPMNVVNSLARQRSSTPTTLGLLA